MVYKDISVLKCKEKDWFDLVCLTPLATFKNKRKKRKKKRE
jgi:hypothetical protein